MKQAATKTLFAYWNGLRGDRLAPERGAIDPAAIRDVLADTFMLEVDSAGRFPIRLSGTRVNGLFDGEQKGRSFLDLWRPEEQRNVAAVIAAVVDGPSPVAAGVVVETAGRPEDMPLEMLLLPLRHNGRTHSRILGLVVPAARRTPAWLGLLPAGPMSLRSLRIVEATAAAVAAGEQRRIAVGQDVDGYDAGYDGDVRFGRLRTYGAEVPAPRPALRVIEGGRSA